MSRNPTEPTTQLGTAMPRLDGFLDARTVAEKHPRLRLKSNSNYWLFGVPSMLNVPAIE